MTADADADRLGGIEPPATDELDKTLGRMLVGEALKQLAKPERVVIVKAHYLGWTIRQIAEDLNVTEAVVKCRLHNALHFLAAYVR